MTDLFKLDGRCALVTGASGGLGRHFAGVLAGAGAKIALAARRADKLREVAADIESRGGTAAIVVMDVTDRAAIQAGLDAAEAALGPVDILVNNSGVSGTSRALEMEQEEWDWVVDTNLKGAWMVAQATAKRMAETGNGGNIINIASILGFRTGGGMAPYMASKAALLHLTHSLALELARFKIRVNAIAPGYILTDLNREYFESPAGETAIKRIPQRRIGQPEDLDGALLLLASDASRYMTGSSIVVDGGHLQSTL